MADLSLPLEQRIAEALGPDALADDATLARLEKEGVITHAEARILWGSRGDGLGIEVEAS